MDNTLSVKCTNIRKSYGVGSARFEALRGIDLEVYKGELMMLVGPSGSGKTTLISVIAGILDQDEGQCIIDGTDLTHMPSKEKTAYRGRNIGFVFQAFNLIPTLTAQENVAIPLILNGIGREHALHDAKDFLVRLGLKDKIHSFPNQLSGGQQQRVAIARGCIHNPRIIVCDEPTSALDHHTGMKVLEVLKGLAIEKHSTLIVVTHDARIFEYADRIAHVDDGRIINNTKNHAPKNFIN